MQAKKSAATSIQVTDRMLLLIELQENISNTKKAIKGYDVDDKYKSLCTKRIAKLEAEYANI